MRPSVYIPELHDPIVGELHARWKLNRYEIAERLGLPADVVRDRMKRLGFKPHPRQVPQYTWQADPKPPRNKPNPLAVAKAWLRGRFVEKPSGFWLDGRPVSLTTLMREANALIRRAGAEQVGPEEWRG